MNKQLRFVKFVLILCFFLFGNSILTSADKEYSGLFGPGYMGTEYMFTIPPNLEAPGAGEENKVSLFIFSPFETRVTVEVKGKGFVDSRTLAPFKVEEFKLNPTVAQPYNKSGEDLEIPEKVYANAAISIKSEMPVEVYVLSRFRQTGEGFLAIPKSGLGNKYIISSYEDGSVRNPLYNSLPSMAGIVATEDNTTVKFTLGGNVQSKTADGLSPGETIEKIINKGDVWMFSSKPFLHSALPDLTGSVINSNKPVSVVTANQCAFIPAMNSGCNYIAEMETPVWSWGYNYNVGRIFGRKNQPVVRVFASLPDTKIYKNGNEIGEISKAGGVLGEGYIELTRDEEPGSYVISSDKPIAVTLYNSGSEEDGLPEPPGGPFQVNLQAVEQYANQVMLFVPGQYAGTYYPDNFINLFFKPDVNGFIPEDLEYALVDGSQQNWKQIRSDFSGYDELIPVGLNGEQFARLTIPISKPGIYIFRANEPINANVYGFSQYDSYGFNGSAKIVTLQLNDTIPPVVEWDINCDGTITGTATDFPEDPLIRSNIHEVVINYSSEGDKIVGWQSELSKDKRMLVWSFNVPDPTKDGVFVLEFSDKKGNKTKVEIHYKAVLIDIEPGEIYFGKINLNEKSKMTFRIINGSETAEIIINQLKLKYGDRGFEINKPVMPVIIPPSGQSEEIEVNFESGTKGVFLDSIGIGDTCIFVYKSELKAEVGVPVINASDVTFGSKTLGKKVSENIQVTNTGNHDLKISGITGPSNSDFTVDINATENVPIIIKPGKALDFKVDFIPTKEGDYRDTIYYLNNAGDYHDPFTIINASGIKPGLEASSHDWGNKRIYRPEFPIAEYTADNIIKLKNTGTDLLQISSIDIIKDENASAFKFEYKAIKGLSLKPGDSVLIPATFLPEQTGRHELKFRYIDNAGANTLTTLSGFGVVPKYNASGGSHDATVVNEPRSISYSTIKVNNLSVDAWMYSDTLTIFDIDALENVSTDWRDDSQPFRVNKDALGLPLKLLPGQQLNIESAFHANEDKQIAGRLKLVTDGTDNPEIILSGEGLSKGVKTTGDESTILLGKTDTLWISVQNKGTADLELGPVFFEESKSEFNFLDPDDVSLPLFLEAGAEENIGIIFTPSKVGTTSTNIFIEDKNAEEKYSAEIKGTAYKLFRDVNVTPLQQYVEVREKAKVRVILDAGDELSEAEIRTLRFTVKYNSEFLKFIESTLFKGSAAQKFEIENPLVDPDAGIITFDMKSITMEPLDGYGELVRFQFDTYLPPDEEQKSEIEIDIEPLGVEGVDFNEGEGSIVIREVCANDLRKVFFGLYEFNLEEITPNPVREATDIRFSLGFEILTNIEIINTNGELIRRIVEEELDPGYYEVSLPTTDLTDGVYFCRMQAGPYTAVRKFIIAR